MLGISLIVCLFWPVPGFLLVCVAGGAIIWQAGDEQYLERKAARKAWAAELADRADRQNAAALRGDPYGLYGEYPPTPEPEEPKEAARLREPVRDESFARHHAELRRRDPVRLGVR